MSNITGHETMKTRKRNFTAHVFDAANLFSSVADDIEQIARWSVDTFDELGLMKDLQKTIHDFNGKLAQWRADMNCSFEPDMINAI